jgi:transposase
MNDPANLPQAYSVQSVARRYGVGQDKVLSWIRSGELEAVNVVSSLAKWRPRWIITPEALERFERRRSSGALQRPRKGT